ncbi:MAG: DUF2157 domain-containing protein [bacterium]|nr:DUF2157 domain-containing protein [bacterium]
MDVISFIVFSIIIYLVGIVQSLKWIFTKLSSQKNLSSNQAISSPNEFQLKERIIAELQSISAQYPNRTISEQIEIYKSPLTPNLIPPTTLKINTTPPLQTTPTLQDTTKPSSQIAMPVHTGSDWYSENSINLLLYIGAFLIVSSAAIFVGYQWQNMPGIFIALLICIITFGFFLTGLLCLTNPKIKNAAHTFIAISAILIPFCGLSWYNFVFKDLGISYGIIWSITSFIMLLFYITITLKLKNQFYSYLSTLSTVSLSLSFVTVYKLNSDFYILSAIASCYVLLFTNIILKKSKSQHLHLLDQPISITSQIILPLSLIFGLMIAIPADKLYSLESTLSIFLAGTYYLIEYITYKKIYQIITGCALLPLSLITLFNWLALEILILYFLLILIALCYLYVSYLFEKNGETKVSYSFCIISNFISALVTFHALITSSNYLSILIFAVTGVLIGIATAKINKSSNYLLISTAYSILAIYIFIHHLTKPLPYENTLLTLLYLLSGISCYLIARNYKLNENRVQIFSFSSIIFLLLSILFSYDSPQHLSMIFIIASIISYNAGLVFNSKSIYASNIFMILSLWQLQNYLNTTTDTKFLSYSCLAYFWYFLGRVTPSLLREQYRFSALALVILTPIINPSLTNSYYNQSEDSKLYALTTAYLATILTALDAYTHKSAQYAYLASAVALTTLQFQFNYLNVENQQFYTTSIAIYFFIIAYFQKNKPDHQKYDALNFIGLLFLILPAFAQTSQENGVFYSLLLGIYGCILLFSGITLSYKNFKYAGVTAIVLAVIPRVIEIVSGLEKWITIGLSGIIFLGVATFLMLRKSDKS